MYDVNVWSALCVCAVVAAAGWLVCSTDLLLRVLAIQPCEGSHVAHQHEQVGDDERGRRAVVVARSDLYEHVAFR